MRSSRDSTRPVESTRLSDSTPPFDVVVLGEVLLEVGTEQPFGHGVPAQLQVSGDALNVAAAAAAAGARVGLVSVLTDDELGEAIRRRVEELGISTELLRTRRGQQGVYLVHSDPRGEREFAYARTGSVGSTLSPEDLDPDVLAAAGAVVSGGITCAVSASARAAVTAAAQTAARFVYDPNYRPRLTSAAQARGDLLDLVPLAALVTPSCPGETTALTAGRRLREFGAGAVAVTCGARGVQLVDGDADPWIDAVPAPSVVDQTGAGDAFVGTLTARWVLGDGLATAARYGVAAAPLVVGGRGGTGLVPTFAQTREHAGR